MAKKIKAVEVIGYSQGVGTTVNGTKTTYKVQHEDKHLDEMFERA
jgi:hypothetical protein